MKFKKPTLLVDREKVERNISRIVEKAILSGTAVWPHFKTHQSHAIGDWFTQAGIDGITVSSVSMARYFTEAGWSNIYIAFPVNINEIEEIASLAHEVNLTLLVNEQVHVAQLRQHVSPPVKLKIEIETGSHRSGVRADDKSLIATLIDQIKASHHVFDGFYSHFGHTYGAANRNEVVEIFNRSFLQLKSLAEHFVIDKPGISLGDTPSASVLTQFNEVGSVHAGNYVFYDLTQAQIGVCHEDDIAITLAAPIVSKNRDQLEFIVYGGGIHLSKEQLHSSEFDQKIYGKIVELDENTWSASFEGCFVRSISQEHGVIKVSPEVFDHFNIGDSLGILPVHSCMTADCMAEYQDMNGNKLDHLQGSRRN